MQDLSSRRAGGLSKLLAAFCLIALIGGCNKQPALGTPSSDQTAFAAEYPSRLVEVRTRFAAGEQNARKAFPEIVALPSKLSGGDPAVAAEVVKQADAAGRSSYYVDEALDQEGTARFFAEERGEIRGRIAGSVAAAAKEQECVKEKADELGGTAAAAAERAVQRELEERLHERGEATRYIDAQREALGERNVAALEKRADAISWTSYLTYVRLDLYKSELEELVAQGIELLLISPKESAPLTAPVAAAHAHGIPVIVIDRRVEGDKFTTFVGADNRRIGRAAGRWAVQALGGKGKIVELEGLMTSSPARERHEGFWAGVERAKHPGIEPIFEADTAWLEPNARREMESALARHARIDLVYAHNDPAAHGAYLAAKAAGREREMKFIGIDALPHEGVRYVREGALDVTFQYSTCAKEAIELALDVLARKPVPKELILGTRMFDKASLESGGTAVE